jgi:hypothetical protein
MTSLREEGDFLKKWIWLLVKDGGPPAKDRCKKWRGRSVWRAVARDPAQRERTYKPDFVAGAGFKPGTVMVCWDGQSFNLGGA